MCLEIVLQTRRVLGCFVPYLTQRNLKQQDTVVVLLYQVFELRIFLLQMGVGVGFHLCIRHLFRQIVLGTGLTDETLVRLFRTLVTHHVALYLLTNRIQRLDTTLTLFIDQVPTVLTTDRITDLTYFQTESRILKRFHHHALTEPS